MKKFRYLELQNETTLSKEDIKKILNSQATREERLSIANEVILNNSSIKSLQMEVLRVHQIYMDLSDE